MELGTLRNYLSRFFLISYFFMNENELTKKKWNSCSKIKTNSIEKKKKDFF